MTCLHKSALCLNEYELIRKYRCGTCSSVMMCACDRENGERFLAHQLREGRVLETQERIPVTLGFVDEVTTMRLDARAFIFPPDPSREGEPWGPLIDAFGDYYEELYRVMSTVDEGWIYYAFRNPATDREEPKASYVKSMDWDGNPAAIGAGIYRRDFPGTCWREEVHAMGLEDDPSPERLQEFVRCAAMELESHGYFATRSLSADPRWRNGSIYVFGLDTYGYTLFSGDPYSNQWYSPIAPELNDYLDGPFGGRDVVSVGDAFGETFLYYSARNPSTGRLQRKVTFVKRVVAYGLPILIGSGYYLDEESPEP